MDANRYGNLDGSFEEFLMMVMDCKPGFKSCSCLCESLAMSGRAFSQNFSRRCRSLHQEGVPDTKRPQGVKGFRKMVGINPLLLRYSFTSVKGFLSMMNELNDIAGQHEMIAENISSQIVSDLAQLIQSMRQDRKRVCLLIDKSFYDL